MLTPLETLEVRWFDQGRIPAGLQAWFDRPGEKQIQPPRTDLYLAGLDSSVGIKLRQGLLEIKPRQADLGGHEFLPGTAGHVGRWIKWGFPVSAADWPGVKSSHWLPVTKSRQMLYYRVTDAGGITASALDEVPERGGSLELTEITLPDEARWWTLGFEIIGQQEYQSEILRKIVLHALGNSSPFDLGLEKSYGYPQWLRGFQKRDQ